MEGRVRAVAIVTGSAIVTFAIVAMATAGSGVTSQGTHSQGADEGALPRGPFIDFCPTLDQIEAHLAEHGFDYKPTVACGEGGEELDTQPGRDQEPVDEQELFEAEKQKLLASTRAPDTDGDPLSVEIILPNGDQAIIMIDGNPKFFDGMTLAELAEVLYP